MRLLVGLVPFLQAFLSVLVIDLEETAWDGNYTLATLYLH